ncbi:hypothetical protein D3C87_1531600 [compost metagenome]
MTNKIAVKKAPVLTVFHSIFTSGRVLNIIPKRIKIIPKLNAKLTASIKNTVISGKYSCNRSVKAKIIPLTTNVTINKKPRPTTKEEDSKRSVINFNHPRFGFALTCHILLIEFCISPKTVVAPINNVMILTINAKLDFPDNFRFMITS